jgi:hypothetical protein
MTSSHSHDRRLSGRLTLIALIATYVAALVGFGCAIWFEWPARITLGLQVATWIVTVLAAICTGRTVERWQESQAFRERSSISGRGAGMLVFVALASLAVACAKLIAPRSWPSSVEQALAMLDAQSDAAKRRQLAYMAYDELAELHDGWGASIRDQFGMSKGNDQLLRDCDREYVHPDICSTVIISRYWKKVRAELPAVERVPLQALETKMERVRLKPHVFKQQPLREVVAFFNEAIQAQLAADARFTIRFDPAQADDLVSVSWHELQPISLREALGRLAAESHLRVSKQPPDLMLQRD